MGPTEKGDSPHHDPQAPVARAVPDENSAVRGDVAGAPLPSSIPLLDGDEANSSLEGTPLAEVTRQASTPSPAKDGSLPDRQPDESYQSAAAAANPRAVATPVRSLPATGTAIPNPHVSTTPSPVPPNDPASPAEAPEFSASPSGTALESPASIPELGDTTAEKPVPGQLRLSEAAIRARLRRTMEPSKRTGERKVSEAVLKQWNSKKGKGKIYQIFQACGWDKEPASSTAQHSLQHRPHQITCRTILPQSKGEL